MPSSVAEALDLLGLRSKVRDAVPYEIDKCELTGNAHRCHVAHHHRQSRLVALAPQLVHHRHRQLDAGHRNTTCSKWDADAPGADRELQCSPRPRQSRQEVNSRVEHVRCEHLGGGRVVTLRSLLVPHFAACHRRQPAGQNLIPSSRFRRHARQAPPEPTVILAGPIGAARR